MASSYLDLQPLYGRSKEDTRKIRTFNRGLIHGDFFADVRMTSQLPGVAALLVLFSRNHNFIARVLFDLNEDDRFSTARFTPAEIDERLFQTARLINCGCYINLILHDYIRMIFGLQYL